jgi:hypothetical protein
LSAGSSFSFLTFSADACAPAAASSGGQAESAVHPDADPNVLRSEEKADEKSIDLCE